MPRGSRSRATPLRLPHLMLGREGPGRNATWGAGVGGRGESREGKRPGRKWGPQSGVAEAAWSMKVEGPAGLATRLSAASAGTVCAAWMQQKRRRRPRHEGPRSRGRCARRAQSCVWGGGCRGGGGREEGQGAATGVRGIRNTFRRALPSDRPPGSGPQRLPPAEQPAGLPSHRHRPVLAHADLAPPAGTGGGHLEPDLACHFPA